MTNTLILRNQGSESLYCPHPSLYIRLPHPHSLQMQWSTNASHTFGALCDSALTHLSSPFPNYISSCILMFLKLTFFLPIPHVSIIFSSFYAVTYRVPSTENTLPPSPCSQVSTLFIHQGSSQSSVFHGPPVIPPDSLGKAVPLIHVRPNAGLVDSELKCMLSSHVTSRHLHDRLQIPTGFSGAHEIICKIKTF